MGNREAKLDVGLDLSGVKCAVEGPELDGALLENAVQVEQVVPGGVVVLVCMVGPVAIVVPNPGELLGGGRAAAVQGREEVRVDGLAPAAPALRADLEGLGQEVFLGVDQVDQVAQGSRGVPAEPDVYVDAAGGVGVCPSRPEGPDAGLHRFDVFPAANRAHELCAVCARAGDAGVRNTLPPPPVRRGDLPSVVGAARVPEGRSFAEGFRDHLRGPLAGDVVHFDLDAEGLGFHGGLLSPGGGFSRPARLCLLGGFPPGAYIHHSAGPKSQRFFCEKGGRASLYMRVGAGKKPGFFSPGGRFFAPGRAHRLAARNRRRAHFPTLLCESPAGGTLLRFALEKSTRTQDFPTLLW